MLRALLFVVAAHAAPLDASLERLEEKVHALEHTHKVHALEHAHKKAGDHVAKEGLIDGVISKLLNSMLTSVVDPMLQGLPASISMEDSPVYLSGATDPITLFPDCTVVAAVCCRRSSRLSATVSRPLRPRYRLWIFAACRSTCGWILCCFRRTEHFVRIP